MSEPVQVFLRLRPISSGEDTAIEVREDGISVRATAPAPLNQRKEFRDPRDYSFTSVMDETTSQVSMYEATTSGIVKSFHDEAKSGLVFTYGVTNAGKSHTVLGNKEDPGLLPRAIERICENLDFEQEDQLYLSYLEIYNEQIFDLLPEEGGASSAGDKAVAMGFGLGPNAGQGPPRKNLQIRDRAGRVVVDGLARHAVTSVGEAMALLDTGSKARATCSNNLNADSSRSHSVCTLELVRPTVNGALAGASASSESSTSLWFVDLAGSERNDRTGVGGASKRQGEANAINTSLFTLMTCLASLRENSSTGGRSKMNAQLAAGRFRESKLTRLLAPHLSGTAAGAHGAGRTCMIVNANPAAADFAETCHVLSQAAPCTKIKVAKAQGLSRAGGCNRAVHLLAAASKFDSNGRRVKTAQALAAAAAKGAAKRLAAQATGSSLAPEGGQGGSKQAGRRARFGSMESIASVGTCSTSGSSATATSSNSSRLDTSAFSSSAELEALRQENARLAAELEASEERCEAIELEVREECAQEMVGLMGSFDAPLAAAPGLGRANSAGSLGMDVEGASTGASTAGPQVLQSARKRKEREDVERVIEGLQERCDDLEDDLLESRAEATQLALELEQAKSTQAQGEPLSSSLQGGTQGVGLRGGVLDALATVLRPGAAGAASGSVEAALATLVSAGLPKALAESRDEPLRLAGAAVFGEAPPSALVVGAALREVLLVGDDSASAATKASAKAVGEAAARDVCALQDELASTREMLQAALAAAETSAAEATAAEGLKSCGPAAPLAPLPEEGEASPTSSNPEMSSEMSVTSDEAPEEAPEEAAGEAGAAEAAEEAPDVWEDHELFHQNGSSHERATANPLVRLDPNSPHRSKKLSKYSPGIVGRTQNRIREQAIGFKKAKGGESKTDGGESKKPRIFSPRRTRSSTMNEVTTSAIRNAR